MFTHIYTGGVTYTLRDTLLYTGCGLVSVSPICILLQLIQTNHDIQLLVQLIQSFLGSSRGLHVGDSGIYLSGLRLHQRNLALSASCRIDVCNLCGQEPDKHSSKDIFELVLHVIGFLVKST